MASNTPDRAYLTSDIAGTGGCIRQRPEDFEVEELPLYPASGNGDHVYITFRKQGLPTREAVHRICRALGRNPESAGVAGLKDSRAVTTQRVSVEHVDPAAAIALDIPGISILNVQRHTNKLRTGHLAGNRFRILIRDPLPGSADRATRIVDILQRKGVPNRFGAQRFGERNDGDLLGRALVLGDADSFLRALLGNPAPDDAPAIQRSRAAFEAGNYAEALEALPGSRRSEKAVLNSLARGKDALRSIRAIPKRQLLFFVSAFQSRVFNAVLDCRLSSLDTVVVGDLAFKHDSGAVFRVEDPTAENERAARFEISPSGPMFGAKMVLPEEEPGRIELDALAAFDVTPGHFRRILGGLRSKGERRPLRVRMTDADVTACDDGLWVSFSLPAGSYATVVLDEIMKTPDR